MKKSILLSAFLATNLLAPTITTLANEEMTETTIKAESSFLTTPEDFYNLHASFIIHTAESPNSNNWTTTIVPIDSKVKLSVSDLSKIPASTPNPASGITPIDPLGIAYIDNVEDFLPQGYIQYSSFDTGKTSTNLISIDPLMSTFPEIWAVPDLNFSDVQNTNVQFKLKDGKTYSLPLKEGSYTPVLIYQNENILTYKVNLNFAAYQSDLEAMVGSGVELNVTPGYVGYLPEGHYQINIDVLGNGNGTHNIDNDRNGGIPFITTGAAVTPSEPDTNTPAPVQPEEKKSLYRLYNTVSGEHFFTTKSEERDQFLTNQDWKEEGIGWTVPEVSDSPIYCVANPNTNDHHYTMDKNEYETLKSLGWIDKGISFYAATGEHQDQGLVPLYRLYNPNHKGTGSHHYTIDENERDTLVSQGWNNEGIAWHGLKSE